MFGRKVPDIAVALRDVVDRSVTSPDNVGVWQSPEEQEGCIPEVLPEADGNCSRLIEMRPTPISSGLKWLTFGFTILKSTDFHPAIHGREF
mgnify:CR=1 FL=1